MGVIGLSRATIVSIEKQRRIEAAIVLEDHDRMKRLIGDSVGEILAAGLTQTEMATLELIRDEHGELLQRLISEAFGRGWVKSGEPNLSNAMEEVLIVAQHVVRGYRNPH